MLSSCCCREGVQKQEMNRTWSNMWVGRTRCLQLGISRCSFWFVLWLLFFLLMPVEMRGSQKWAWWVIINHKYFFFKRLINHKDAGTKYERNERAYSSCELGSQQCFSLRSTCLMSLTVGILSWSTCKMHKEYKENDKVTVAIKMIMIYSNKE